MEFRAAVYADVADEIPQAALLLWRRGNNLINRLIAGPDRSNYAHAATACRRAGELWSLEFLQWQGPVDAPLWLYVRDYPGRIDVFAPNAGGRWNYLPEAAVEEMQRLMRRFRNRYGWHNLLRAGRWFVPWLRLFGHPSADDAANGDRPPHCVMARVLADTAAGVDPVPNTPAYLTTPGDLARSLFYEYRYTLFWTPEQADAARKIGHAAK